VTDHRINLTLYKLDSIIAGNMGPVIDAPDGTRATGAAQWRSGPLTEGGMTNVEIKMSKE